MGRKIKVLLSRRLRDEIQFPDVSLLIAQIKKDVRRAARTAKN
jgi:FAD synthase